MIQREDCTWARNPEQSPIRLVLIGQAGVLTQPISFQTAIIVGQRTIVVILVHMKIGLGVFGMAASGTFVCWKTVVSKSVSVIISLVLLVYILCTIGL